MITPEFEKEFRELCEKHNVLAAFVTIDSCQNCGDIYLGGHKATCQQIGEALRFASNLAQAIVDTPKNATKH